MQLVAGRPPVPPVFDRAAGHRHGPFPVAGGSRIGPAGSPAGRPWDDQPDDRLWDEEPDDEFWDDASEEPADQPMRRGPARGDRVRGVVRGVGELLVTCGLVLLLFVVYEVYVTDFLTDRRQDELSSELQDRWADAPAEAGLVQVEIGDAFGVLRIPRLGEDYARVILEGTTEGELSQGPGHYAGTAMPGEPGNVALAGHRVGKGSPFLELDLMQPGDPIVVETADRWFVYRVLGDPATGDLDTDPSGIPGRQIVSPADVSVIAPTPNQAASAGPTGSYLTLTTCHPRFSARQRLIIHARLDGAGIPKAEMPDGPPALREG
ncbi:class E sortase [Blastococcus sp. VKM Ac-2987]|uniref:class E sortase n=1 Tax=Blastococcus sp. VKM Ac-2987 TaxID=3004141 RepID=UPI0022ABC377|nr:class E sortase [Blastococcus sp. VKM Ac-2987]MCZ2858543.1 class E sortase [Blastococcus sp. VKM Ac-2987]